MSVCVLAVAGNARDAAVTELLAAAIDLVQTGNVILQQLDASDRLAGVTADRSRSRSDARKAT